MPFASQFKFIGASRAAQVVKSLLSVPEMQIGDAGSIPGWKKKHLKIIHNSYIYTYNCLSQFLKMKTWKQFQN